MQLGYVILYVADVGASVDFYERAFGLTRRFISPEGDYGELDTGSTTLAMASASLAASNLVTAGGYRPLDAASPPPGISITLVAADVASALQRALDAGASAYVDAHDMPWGQTVAYLRDPDGVLVELATPMG